MAEFDEGGSKMGLTARETLEKHCQATCEGRGEESIGNVLPEVKAGGGMRALAKAVGKVQPTAYEILEETTDGPNSVFKYRYIGEKAYFDVKGTWGLREGAWKVVAVELLELVEKE